ncbi:MAG: type II secretion system F family protein [Candidatus Binatia bacterium]
MASYAYQALDSEGNIVEGVMDADAESVVVANLRVQGQRPLSVAVARSNRIPGSMSFPALDRILSRNRVKSRELMTFTRELATLLRAGLPLDRSLQSLANLTENDALGEIIKDVLGKVREGQSMSQALSGHPRVFSALYINMIKAGEAGGVVESILERLAEYLEAAENTREEIKSAMTYPAILGVVGSGAIVILLTYVLPKFAVLFEDLGAAMPASTRFVMGMSGFLQDYWWVLGLVAVGAWQAFRRYTSTDRGRLSYDNWKLSLPLLGDFVQKVHVANFARTLGTMLKSGVPLIQSLEIVRAVVSNEVIKRALEAVQRDVSEGKGMAVPLERSAVFPSLALQMVQVGEDTGRLDEMLLVVGSHYEREVSNAVNRLMSLLEPAMLVIMGLIAGFIVISMMSAVFSVNELVG